MACLIASALSAHGEDRNENYRCVETERPISSATREEITVGSFHCSSKSRKNSHRLLRRKRKSFLSTEPTDRFFVRHRSAPLQDRDQAAIDRFRSISSCFGRVAYSLSLPCRYSSACRFIGRPTSRETNELQSLGTP